MVEPASTISGAIAKALSAIKDFPLWFLIAIALSLIVFLSVPEFSGAVSQEARTWVTVAAVTAVIFAVSRFGSVVASHLNSYRAAAKTRRNVHEERIRRFDLIRYSTVYMPLFAQLFQIHIETTQSERAPKFQDRLQNSWDILSSRRRRAAALKAAWRALSDRQLRVSGEVLYGGQFPIEMLKDVVEQNLDACDDKLLKLISAADQSHIEAQFGYDEVTQEDIELHDYIMSEHARLKKRLER
jgi:hypothetical protein